MCKRNKDIAKVMGNVPLKIPQVLMAISLTLALTTKTDMPNGGVSKPISMATMVIMPNQIKLVPKPSNSGMTNGKSINMMDKESKKQPNTKTVIKYKNSSQIKSKLD